MFVLFAGGNYYPQGGMYDLVRIGTIEECKAAFVGWLKEPHEGVGDSPYWAHIAEMSAGKIVLWAGDKERDRSQWDWFDKDPSPWA